MSSPPIDPIARTAPTPPLADAELCREVDAALAACELERAREAAKRLRHAATAAGQPAFEARALLRQAQCDLADAKPEDGLERAKAAARQFEQLGRRAEEIEALAVWSRAASCLGRFGESLETALLASALAEQAGGGPMAITPAGLAAGAAHGWAGRLQSAVGKLERVRQLGEAAGDQDLVLAARCERCWAEAAWQAGRRGRNDERTVLSDTWRALLAAIPQADPEAPRAAARKPGVDRVMYAALAGGLAAVWSGEFGPARKALEAYQARAQRFAPGGWLPVAAAWLESECHWHAGEWEAAALQAELMVKWAQASKHQPLLLLGLRLLADCHRRLGRADEALRLVDTLMAQERRLRDQELDLRADAVECQLSLRGARQHLVNLESETSLYRRWAHEDELTGLANTRRFNECLGVWTEQAREQGEDLCVAMIDVDRFKAINDRHGHPVGDEVLRVVAQAITQESRDEDLKVRWGGDEFAILFRNTQLSEAEAVAERIQARVATHDWARVVKRGQVSVSVGVALAEPGDTKRTLVERSDARLYARKAVRDLKQVLATVPAPMLNNLVAALRKARQVVMFVGAAGGSQAALPPATLAGYRADPEGFRQAWAAWRDEQKRARTADKSLQALVRMTHPLRRATFVTERVDGLLAMAGAVDVIELYGHAFDDRCDHCGRVRPNTDGLHCLACGHPEPGLRPAVLLHGEQADPRQLASAELLFKRADLVMVLDSDLATRPGSLLVDKAAARGAQVVIVGERPGARRPEGSWWLPVDPGLLAGVLTQLLSDPSAEAAEALQAPGLSAAGLCVRQLLAGRGRDRRDLRLEDFVELDDWNLSRRLPALAWLFPLVTPSRIDPLAPVPSAADFAILAADPQVRTGQRRALERVQRYYGFVARDGQVVRSPDWRGSFALWAPVHSHHDLLISRVLGSLCLCGLGAEAKAFLAALEPELLGFRGAEDAAVTLRFWRQALEAA